MCELETRQNKNVENINLFEFKSSCQRATKCIIYENGNISASSYNNLNGSMWKSLLHVRIDVTSKEVDAAELEDMSLVFRSLL
jgi:hypothetical protein